MLGTQPLILCCSMSSGNLVLHILGFPLHCDGRPLMDNDILHITNHAVNERMYELGIIILIMQTQFCSV